MSFLSQAFQSQSANNTFSIVSPENSTKVPLGGQNEFFQGTFVPSANYSVVQLSCLSNTLVEIIVESSFDGIAYTVTDAFFNTQEDIDTTRAAPFYSFITLPYVRILIQNIDTITNTIFEFCTKLTSTSPPANQIAPAPVVIIGTVQVQDLAAEESLATIDGKIISCDTSDVTITNPIPAGSNEIGSVVLRAYNVTAATYLDLLISDTQNLKVVEENSADILTAVNSIDGKIVTCDTSAVVVSSGSITETNSGAIAASLVSINDNIVSTLSPTGLGGNVVGSFIWAYNSTIGSLSGLQADAALNLKVVDANSSAIASSVASIDGHIIGCNTDAVIVASGSITETNSSAIAASVASIDGHIVACNTDAVIIASGSITETNSSAIAASVASIDGHIVACNTDAVIVASGSITETNSAAIAASVASIDGHIIGCNTDAVTISTALPAGTNTIGAVNLRAYNNAIPGEITLNSKISSESNNCLCVTDLAADKLEINANTPSYVQNIGSILWASGSGFSVDLGLGEYRYRNATVMLNVTTISYPNPAVMLGFSEDNTTFYFDGNLASFYNLGANTKSCVLQRTQVPSRYVKVFFINDTDVLDGIITLQKS